MYRGESLCGNPAPNAHRVTAGDARGRKTVNSIPAASTKDSSGRVQGSRAPYSFAPFETSRGLNSPSILASHDLQP